ncbi:hypothetical protein Psyc_1022 [Psychrobacter arcticus 273-4]|uniref:Uncharacterized protein n=1 Tax=Psychrobacter arcticus (strain DSM 17307 / VKM B-2377 / 273-4) TaxID=259536 RepID=Q4FSY3_PSYA2|nr:hypothetical protein [Psychrobacter arcticus]AAZ18875.1 hypothetical protein Psyc_1022 [Psychrobacter arcticus 273-4]
MADFIPSSQLNFTELRQPTSDIQFGASGAANNDVNVRISANINATSAGQALSAEPLTGVSIHAFYQLNATASGTASYDSNVDRLATHDVSSDMQNGKLTGIDKRSGYESNEQLSTQVLVNWQQSSLIGTDNQAIFESNEKLQTSSKPVFESSELIGTPSKQLYESQAFMAHSRAISNEGADRISISNWFGYEAMLKRQTERQIVYEGADWLGRYRNYSNRAAQVLANDFAELIETAKVIYSAHSERFIIIDNSVPIKSIDLVLLDFTCRWYAAQTELSFGASCQYQNPLPDYKTGVTFVTNSVSLTRSDDGREIKLLDFSVGIDSNSYAWSFSATVPLSELSKVNTALEQRIGVEFTCNGNLWRFILDGCDDSISFGESSLTIKGKSRAMLLASPYAAARDFKYTTALSARQIAEDELNRGGVPSGFTLDWQLAGVNGWNVPANTYSYTGKTPINSLQWIAEAAGGFINADMSADIIHMLEQYPIKSWEWALQTPSINLTQSLITSRSRGRINKPAYNGVLLYGEHDTSFGGLIKRTGTAGGYQPPMITSDLMTDQLAAISRGKMILSDTGDIGNIGISMPLVADVGVLKPSTLIGVNDGESWVGMVRGTTITGRPSSNRALEVDQSINVERHFDKG